MYLNLSIFLPVYFGTKNPSSYVWIAITICVTGAQTYQTLPLKRIGKVWSPKIPNQTTTPPSDLGRSLNFAMERTRSWSAIVQSMAPRRRKARFCSSGLATSSGMLGCSAVRSGIWSQLCCWNSLVSVSTPSCFFCLNWALGHSGRPVLSCSDCSGQHFWKHFQLMICVCLNGIACPNLKGLSLFNSHPNGTFGVFLGIPQLSTTPYSSISGMLESHDICAPLNFSEAATAQAWIRMGVAGWSFQPSNLKRIWHCFFIFLSSMYPSRHEKQHGEIKYRFNKK